MTITVDRYGHLIERKVLKIQRLLPGPIERVWSYLTESELRRKWLAAGDMVLAPGAEFEFTWRNNELTDPPGTLPEGASAEHSMRCRFLEVDAPHLLKFTWGVASEVTFTLEPAGEDVLLTVLHRGAPDRNVLLSVSSGWHMHLDVLVAAMTGTRTGPFWDGVVALKKDYATRYPE